MNGIDANKDGVIDRAEWSPIEKEAFAATEKIDKKYDSISNPDDITRMFAEYDANGDSKITFGELTQGLCKP